MCVKEIDALRDLQEDVVMLTCLEVSWKRRLCRCQRITTNRRAVGSDGVHTGNTGIINVNRYVTAFSSCRWKRRNNNNDARRAALWGCWRVVSSRLSAARLAVANRTSTVPVRTYRTTGSMIRLNEVVYSLVHVHVYTIDFFLT